MVFELPKGKYVIAVSGGVDSVVLLHMLATGNYDSQFVVAHFDHGIRPESVQDAQLVEQLAKSQGLQFVVGRAKLGAEASEDQARRARYDFLRSTLKQANAVAIITAHHQDDLLETILLHVQRGTGRAGLTPMQSTDILRPLLYVTKKQILQYAQGNKLAWHDDPTNQDTKYARNKIRAQLAAANPAIGQQLLAIHKKMLPTNADIQQELQVIYDYAVKNNEIVRARLVQLPYAVQKEIVYLWLKTNGVQNIQKLLVQNTVMACKTYLPSKKMSLGKNIQLACDQKHIKILQK